MESKSIIIMIIIVSTQIITTNTPESGPVSNHAQKRNCIAFPPGNASVQSYSLCNKVAKFDKKVCDFENKTLTILNESNARKAEVIFGTGSIGTLTTGILHYIRKNKQTQRLFPDGGLLSLGGTSILASIIKSVGILVASAYAWHRFKQWILEPYRIRYKEEIEKFKLELAEHKRELLQTQQSFTSALEDSLRSTLNAELKNIYHEHKGIQGAHSRLHDHMQEVERRLEADFITLQQDVKKVRSTTEEIQTGVTSAIPKLAQMYALIQYIQQQTREELKRINTLLDDKKGKNTKKEQRFSIFRQKK